MRILRPRNGAIFALLIAAAILASCVVEPSPTSRPAPATPAAVESSPEYAPAQLASPVSTAVASATTPAVESQAPAALGPGLHDFTLPDAHGGQVTLSQYLGKKNVVLVFYRAWW